MMAKVKIIPIGKEVSPMEVTLQQILEVREQRSRRQMQLIREFGRPLVSFSMNIPGPVKDSPIIRRGFRAGCRL